MALQTQQTEQPVPSMVSRACAAELVEQGRSQVTHVARGYFGRGLDLEDLLAAGNLGLVEAARRFDPERKIKFATYAVWWIRKSILQALELHAGPVRLPRYQLDRLRAVRTAQQGMQRSGQDADDRQRLADRAGVPADSIDGLLQLRAFGVSIDHAVTPGQQQPLKDSLADPAADCPQVETLRRDREAQLRRRLATLDRRERQVISMRFGLYGSPERTLRETGDAVGLSREGVRQVERRVLSKLRAAL